ncbi:MAG TPA: maltose alpha-D-glucosyltransferase, partial [Candidatus Acidoferrales bacterium]|nr:maltose alpha-D-glucosyltransferase [Candidatus Acidoferrales bacterium]
MRAKAKLNEPVFLENNPQWYKDAVIYEIHVRAFSDGNGDGIGDFGGLAQKLDFLQDLGVTALWLLPFYPSPLKDDGYDIADYTDIHPDYGTLQDFKLFLREAHRRGIRVITELVVNHTSDQHPWFQRARSSPAGSSMRNFYVWSDIQEKYSDARIIFRDFEPSNWAWDPVAKSYYWHRFYSHQPDLNFDNADVRKALFEVLDFWLSMGVDGMRLDAVPYLYEREDTNCENLPETHEFLKELRRHVDEHYTHRMLLAEANQWPEDAAAYFGAGDECHMAFHFPVMPRIFMAVHMEDRFPIIDILEQTPAIPESCQWALFLRNHDELTLEMVTDEDRDYMYKVYAQDPRARINLGIRRRLAPLLGNNRRKMELLHSLLFSLPGTPVIYYGDEIGMGDNIYLGDRNGVRTPMQWSADRNAGFSRANPQRLYLPVIIDPEHHYETVNVEAQQQNPSSFLWWMKRLVLLRKSYQAFGRGAIEFLFPENRKVLVFVRRFQEETILVVANLSRFVQFVELELSAYKEMIPVELFGQTRFPAIGELPYFLTLGPHSFYWFRLEPLRASSASLAAKGFEPAHWELSDSWESVFRGRAKTNLERFLPEYLLICRWFGDKARTIRSLKMIDVVPAVHNSDTSVFTLWDVQYTGGATEVCLLTFAFAVSEKAFHLRQHDKEAVIARLKITTANSETEGILYDALYDPDFCKGLLSAIERARSFRNTSAELRAQPSKRFRAVRGEGGVMLEPSMIKRGPGYTFIAYGDRLVLKFFHRVAEGLSPDVEIGRFLSEKTHFAHAPVFAGHLELGKSGSEASTIGILQGLVANEGNAWRYTLDRLGHYFEDILSHPLDAKEALLPETSLIALTNHEVPPLAQDTIGAYLSSARLLGQRTGELHTALASEKQDPAFVPEPFTTAYRRSLYQRLRTLADNAMDLLKQRLHSLPEAVRQDAEKLLRLESRVFAILRRLLDHKIAATRIRCHGQYCLEKVLFTGKDFVITDFAGQSSLSLSVRRQKRSTLRDIASMIRSFHRAAAEKLKDRAVRPEDAAPLKPWAKYWTLWVSVEFLNGLFETASQERFIPQSHDESQLLLDVFLLENLFDELNEALNHRPDWIHVPLADI